MTRRVGKITRVISYDHHEEENRAGLSCDNIAIARKDFNFPETKLISATRVLQVRSMAVDPHKEYSHALTSVDCRTRPFNASLRL